MVNEIKDVNTSSYQSGEVLHNSEQGYLSNDEDLIQNLSEKTKANVNQLNQNQQTNQTGPARNFDGVISCYIMVDPGRGQPQQPQTPAQPPLPVNNGDKPIVIGGKNLPQDDDLDPVPPQGNKDGAISVVGGSNLPTNQGLPQVPALDKDGNKVVGENKNPSAEEYIKITEKIKERRQQQEINNQDLKGTAEN